MWKLFLCAALGLAISVKAESPCVIPSRNQATTLIYDLEIASYFDALLSERLPVTYNHLLSAGYLTTPSARMNFPGTLGVGVARVPPYMHLNGLMQLFSHLELTANYRIFRNVDDPGLSPHGFGDFADRGANFKIALFTPEDTDNIMPGIAFGVEDFMGTKAFTNYFVVATKVFMEQGLETSVGWGAGRYTKGPSRGFFGGFAWFPFWRYPTRLLKGLSFTAEYDPIDYTNPEREPHPLGNFTDSPLNLGVKYQFRDLVHFSGSWIRGDAFAATTAFTFNFGDFDGFLLKIDDSLPYFAPIDTEPIGCHRPEPAMIQHLAFAFQNQGFLLTEAWMENGSCRLWIRIINQTYRRECQIRDRVAHLLAALTPSDISEVVVILESYALSCQQYVYPRSLLCKYHDKKIADSEFELLTLSKAARVPGEAARRIFYRPLDLWRCRLSPRYETFWGSSKGKFKYDLGIKAEFEGFLPCDLYYELQWSYTLASTLRDVSDFDRYNPSQLPNVNTDYVRYRQQGAFSTDRAFLQKSWNFGRGFFGRAAGGYFQVNYGGVAGELLFYPVHSLIGVGLEGAVLKKRRYNGLGFQDKLRRLDGFTPTFVPYTTLEQYFLDLYLDFPLFSIASKLSFGQFLARDKGLRLELTRYFENGLRLTGWMTYTNAGDTMHGENYYNRGIAIEFPLDFFYKCSCKRVFNYGMAAWLRDAGAFTTTGKTLFEILNRERQ